MNFDYDPEGIIRNEKRSYLSVFHADFKSAMLSKIEFA